MLFGFVYLTVKQSRDGLALIFPQPQPSTIEANTVGEGNSDSVTRLIWGNSSSSNSSRSDSDSSDDQRMPLEDFELRGVFRKTGRQSL